MSIDQHPKAMEETDKKEDEAGEDGKDEKGSR